MGGAGKMTRELDARHCLGMKRRMGGRGSRVLAVTLVAALALFGCLPVKSGGAGSSGAGRQESKDHQGNKKVPVSHHVSGASMILGRVVPLWHADRPDAGLTGKFSPLQGRYHPGDQSQP